jgi:type VI secretion system protein ImpK
MSSSDPFGLDDGRGRTRVRPPPGGRGFAVREASGFRPPPTSEHRNPLIGAFAALLDFAPELESASAPADPETLRTRLLEAVISGRDAGIAQGNPSVRADAAAWAVAALLDDLALNTPWGGHSAWPRHPLVSTLYGDVDAGVRFFDRLEELERHAARDPEMIELYYTCLALGFRGKYRVPGRAGSRSLAAVRSAAARLLRDPDSDDLSGNWQGVIAKDTLSRSAVPLWVAFAVAAVLAAGVYLLLEVRLAGQAEQLGLMARTLPPTSRAEIFRAHSPDGRPSIEPAMFELKPEFEAAAPGALLDTMDITENASLTKIVIQSNAPELFRSARAQLSDGFEPLIASIGQVIGANADLIGSVTVVGHTDSERVSASNPFGDNQGLSEARANTIAAILLQAGAPTELVRAEGRAATEPVASNDTPEGKALNRRVEILVEKRL